jgi:integrase
VPAKRLNPVMLERIGYDRRKALPSGRMEIRDEVVRGLELRITPDGRKSFSVRYKVVGEGGVNPINGRPLTGGVHRITLGTLDLTAAREEARRIVEAATLGKDPRAQRREEAVARHGNSFLAVRQRFIELEIKPSVKNWKTVESTLRLHVEPKWAVRPVMDIRRADVHQLLDELKAAGKIAVAREVRTHLSRFFNYCVNRDIIAASPVAGLERKDLRKGVDDEAGRALSDAELRSVWRASFTLGYPLGPMYRMLILTGQRLREWAWASRSEIDATSRLLEVPKARYKGRRDHVVPMMDDVWHEFAQLPEWTGGNDYFLFSTTKGERPVSGFTKAKERLDKAAGVKVPFRVHDFRVTCETRLASLGFDQDTRDAVLGHAKAGLQKTYNKHQYLDEKRAALKAYAEHVLAVVK